MTPSILRYFKYDHLPPFLQDASKPFSELADHIVETTMNCDQRDVALQKLLEAKDAAVRAKVDEMAVKRGETVDG